MESDDFFLRGSLPDVESGDNVPILEAAQQIAERNPTIAYERALTWLMRDVMKGILSVFSLRANSGCYQDDNGVVTAPLLLEANESHGEDIVDLPLDKGSIALYGQGAVTEKRSRHNYTPEELLTWLHGLSRFGHSDVGPQYLANEATFNTLAIRNPLEYDPNQFMLSRLRIHASNLATWCANEELMCPPAWRRAIAVAADASANGLANNTAPELRYVSGSALTHWYDQRARVWPPNKHFPSREQDLEDARRAFPGKQINRELLRSLRPKEWRKRGRRVEIRQE